MPRLEATHTVNEGVDSWDSAGATDVGLVRQLNEDSFLDRPDRGLWVVADGMGGHACGDVASQMLCAQLNELLYSEKLSEAVNAVDDCITGVNQELIALAQSEHAGNIVGSTVIAMVARGQQCACLWAGDSRLYRLRDGLLSCLSEDHSLVGDAYAANSNIITRAVGSDAHLVLDVDAFNLIKGDRYLLCSDGLSKELSDAVIAQILLKGGVRETSAALIEGALKAGGGDNVTVIVADYCPVDHP